MLRSFIRVTGDILFGLVIVLLVVGILVASTSKTSKDGYPGLAGYRLFTVLSGSMSPTLNPGSVVLTAPADVSRLRQGDIITFKVVGTGLITHRIVMVKKECRRASFITRGDANKSVDENPVSPDQIVGRVIFSLPYLGYLSAFAQTKTGFLTLIVLPALLLILVELRNVWVYLEEESRSAG